MTIIQRDRSIIPACDVPLEKFEKIVRETGDVEGVGGFKIPATSGREGWEEWVIVARATKIGTDKPLIYDHQKAGTDIPDTGEYFMEELKESGIDAVILFPEAGPVTQYEWTRAAQEQGLGVIVGGEMTHPRYLNGDSSNGKKKDYTQIFGDLGMERDLTGYVRSHAPEDIYELAARMGVIDFVMPGNKPDKIRMYKQIIEDCGVSDPAIYSPGLIAQGGDLSEGAKAAGKKFHGIVGRGIYNTEDIRQVALDLTSHL